MKKRTLGTLLLVLALIPTVGFAASDMYLKIDGVKGETTAVSAEYETMVAPPATGIVRPISPIACTMDAKQCPDGSFVGRTGPNCEFAQCTSEATGVKPVVPPPPRSTGDPDFDLLRTTQPKSPLYNDPGTKGENPMYEDGKRIVPQPMPSIRDIDDDNDGVPSKTEDSHIRDFDRDGFEDLLVSEPNEHRAEYIKFGGVRGEGKDEQTATTARKDIRKNITVNLRVHELRDADEEKRKAVLASAPTSSDAVKTGDDLVNFILRDALTNPLIEEVDITPEKTVISHEAEGKFLGLIKMSFPQRVEIDTDGAVTVRLPWYSFLVNEDIDVEDIEEAGAKKKKETINMDSVSWGVSQAGAFSRISNVLKTKHDTVKNSINNVR